MKNIINIAIIGLGQIGNHLFNEIKIKKRDRITYWKKINIVAISAKNKNKKENLKLTKKFSIKILLELLIKIKLIFYSSV